MAYGRRGERGFESWRRGGLGRRSGLFAVVGRVPSFGLYLAILFLRFSFSVLVCSIRVSFSRISVRQKVGCSCLVPFPRG